mgnify:CR=1 FL=1
MAGRPRTVDYGAALQALWGRSSSEAAEQLGCSAGHLRRILAGLPDGVRAAYRVALAARQAVDAMPTNGRVRLAAMQLNGLAAEQCAQAMLADQGWSQVEGGAPGLVAVE